MSVPIGQVNLTGSPGIFVSPNQGLQGLIISNESPYTITVSLQGTSLTKNLLPETVDFFRVYQGFNGNISYTPATYVTNPSAYTQANLFFETVGLNEQFNAAQYPMSLSRQAVTPTASGKPLFTALFNVDTTTTNRQSLCVFNPATSGVNAYFHSLQIFTDDATFPSAFVFCITGANLALPTSLSARSHTGSSSPPTSAMAVTAADSNTDYSSGNPVDRMHIPQKTPTELIVFPDQIILQPGNNLLLELAGASSSHTVILKAKYSEGQ